MRLFLYRLKEQSATAAAAATSNWSVKVVGLVDIDRQTRLSWPYLSSRHRKCTCCENGTAKLRRRRWPTVFILLSASASTRGHERTSAAELLRHPGDALSSSASRHYCGEITRVLVIIKRSKSTRYIALPLMANKLEWRRGNFLAD